MEEVKEKVLDEQIEEIPEGIELQTTFNEDGLDVLCEDAEIENKDKEGE